MNDTPITVMALGGAGCRIMKVFAGQSLAGNFRLLAVDSDEASLRESGLPPENTLQAGRLLRSGQGCGGDVIAGQQALANERKELNRLLAGSRVLIVVAGLGGGLATGGMSVVLGVASKMRIASAVLATLPFSMEGYRRRHLAEEKMKSDILPIADAVVALPNDLLFSTLDAETSMTEAFDLSDREIARSLLAIASILGGGNLFSADFASFTGVLKRRHTLCAFGTALVENGENAPDEAMAKMLASPLLGGPGSIDAADVAAFSLLGGPELSMGQARAVLDLCSRQIAPDSDKTILLGAAAEEMMRGRIQLSVLTVRYLDALPSAVAGHRHGHRHPAEDGGEGSGQMTLPNLIVENKGIMENTAPVMLDGEDLDVPTFKRRGKVIDTGR